MSNERNEMEEIERQFEQIIERLIALLPTDGRTKMPFRHESASAWRAVPYLWGCRRGNGKKPPLG
jgi:hypothetical protein